MLFEGTWLHVYNPELTGNGDHDANPGKIIPNPNYRPELDEHYAGDGCAIYDSSAIVERRGASGTSFASDLEPGDVFRDPTETTWWQVSTVVTIDDDIHVECDDAEMADEPGTATA